MTSSGPGNTFLSVIEALKVPFLFERSCKLVEGRVISDRFLTSIERGHLGDCEKTLVVKVADVLRGLGFPPEGDFWLSRHSAGAGVVHFGFEADGDHPSLKIYLEYVHDARRALANPAGLSAPVTVHRALKWAAGTNRFRETTYQLQPSGGLTLERRVAIRSGDLGAVRVFVKAVLRRALAKAAPRDLILLDVADAGCSRRSFDLQLYEAGLTMPDVEEDLVNLGQGFGLSRESMQTLWSDEATSQFGHVAGGRDSAGALFATVYFGACGR